MKISNPTVFIESGSGVLKMCTVEVPTRYKLNPIIQDVALQAEYNRKDQEYEAQLRSAKASAVEVRNREFASAFLYRVTKAESIKPDTFYQLTGYVGERKEEIDPYVDPYGSYMKSYALITPSINNSLVEEESQEDLLDEILDMATDDASIYQDILNKFTITRKK